VDPLEEVPARTFHADGITMLLQSRARLRVWLMVSVVAGVCAFSPAADQHRKMVVNPTHCSRLSDTQQRWLTSEWQPYLEYTRICAIQNSKRENAVLLVSVHAGLYYKAQPGQSVPQVKMPNPLLFLPSGEVSGSLPYNFPDDPPAELRVTFVGWVQGFPERIELYLSDPRAAGDRSLPPLIWDESKKKFVSKENGSHD
jgi:hypothetical protein